MRFLEHVNELTEDDFNNPELYFEISEIQTNVARTMAINQFAQQAKKLRIKSVFDSNLKALKQDLKQGRLLTANGAQESNVTSFSILEGDYNLPELVAEDMSHIPGQLNCGAWICDDSGVRIRTDKCDVVVCPHPIFPAKVLRNIESGKYKVEIIFQLRGKVETIFIPREILASSSKIVELAGYAVQVKSRSAALLSEYFTDMEQYNPDVIKEFTSTSRLGWVSDGKKTVFLPYHREIVYDNVTDFKSLFDSIRSHGSREAWYKCVKEIRAKRQPEVLINLAASFASVLVEIVNALPFIVSLWGGTGIGKSVILKVCTSVWADPREGRYMTDAKATYSAMEMRLNALNSLPMTLDDMAQVNNQYDKGFSELIYRWCAGQGKDRSNKNLGINPHTRWRNCTITNGERSLVDESTQGGAINRVIDIEASGDVLFDGRSGNRTVKTVEENYGFAGEEFIDAIETVGFEKINVLYGSYYEKIKHAADEEGVEKEDKQAMPMALILLADYLSEKYLFEDGVLIDTKTAISYLRNKGEISEVETAYENLMDELLIHGKNFATTQSKETHIANGIDFWGCRLMSDSRYMAIIPSIFDKFVGSSSLSKSLKSWALKKGILLTDKGEMTKTVRITGEAKAKRMVVIRTDWQKNQENTDDEIDVGDPPFD